MIVCHCSNISDHEIRSAIDWMRAADPDTIITPERSIARSARRPTVVDV
jgi:hypothetical protein